MPRPARTTAKAGQGQPGQDEAAAYIQRLHEDFGFFVEELWKDRGLDKVAPLGDVERDIIQWVQHGPTRRGVKAFRGIGKTHFITAAYTCWRLRRDPDTKILIVSKSKIPNARDTVRIIREWLEAVWFLQDLCPANNPDGTDQTFQFDVAGAKGSRTPSVLAQGIDGHITGSRAHVIIADDVESANNTKTQDAREDLIRAVTEFRAIASYGDKEIIYVGTPHDEQSLYDSLAKKGYEFRSWPKCYPTPEERVDDLAPMLRDRLDRGLARPGELTCPHRFTAEDIAEDQAEGRRYWLMQCQLVSNLGDTNLYPLRLADIMVLDVARDSAPISVIYGQQDHNGSTAIEEIPSRGFLRDRFHRPIRVSPEWAPYAATVGWIDPAGVGQDSTALSIIGYLAGLYHAKRVTAFEGGGTEANFISIALALRQTGARQVYIETNWGGALDWAASFEPVLARFYIQPGEHPEFPDGWTCAVITDPKITHVSGQKELRIFAALEPVITGHRMIFDRSVAENGELQFQLTHLTRQRGSLKHEDLADSLAGCVHALGHTLRIDPQKAADRAEMDLFDAQIKKFHSLFGPPVEPPAPRFGFSH